MALAITGVRQSFGAIRFLVLLLWVLGIVLPASVLALSGGPTNGGGTGNATDNLAAKCLLPKPYEIIATCPTVECDPNVALKGVGSIGSLEFVKRVQAYFSYIPPVSNRLVYLNPKYHDYQINKPKERTRPPASETGNRKLFDWRKMLKDLIRDQIQQLFEGMVLQVMESMKNLLMSTVRSIIQETIDFATGFAREQALKMLKDAGINLPPNVLNQLEATITNTINGPISTVLGGGVTQANATDVITGRVKDQVGDAVRQQGFPVPDILLDQLGKQIKGPIDDAVKKAQGVDGNSDLSKAFKELDEKTKGLLSETIKNGGVPPGEVEKVTKKAEKEISEALKKAGINVSPEQLDKIINGGLAGNLDALLGKAAKLANEEIDKLVDALEKELDGLVDQAGNYLQDKVDKLTEKIGEGIDSMFKKSNIPLSADKLKGVTGEIGKKIFGWLFGGCDNGVVNECGQDNRMRDMCLMGEMAQDNDALISNRAISSDEEPLWGVTGSSPVYRRNSPTLNCMPPKNTERVSPLEFDNGWRYRDMCPGDQKLRRVERDQLEEKLDFFRGEYGCLAPLPKCDLKDDWNRDTLVWKNQEYKPYLEAFEEEITSTLGAVFGEDNLQQKLKEYLTSAQFENIKKLMDPQQSAAAECKPAFWVRLMLDACANQYVLARAMYPQRIYNPDGRQSGYSERFCQVLETKQLSAEENDDYNVADYLRRAQKGLIGENDYFPHIKYERFSGPLSQVPHPSWSKPRTGWSNEAKSEFQKIAAEIPEKLTLNQYLSKPVERIIDPSHPFSPRNDIAETVRGEKLLDRNLFPAAGASAARPALEAVGLGLKKYYCVPAVQKGYWEFGCTVYCSAVNVDLLRFRYKDYRLCMGCQIDTNEFAFWEEYNVNRLYYKTAYCDPPYGEPPACEYGSEKDKEICGACGKMRRYIAELAVTQTALVTAEALCKSGSPFVAPAACAVAEKLRARIKELTEKLIPRYTLLCPVCYTGASAEALERTRSSTNVVTWPMWGPTAVGANWPVCSTRFDHKGLPGLCKAAKAAYGGCALQGGLAATDVNIGKPSMAEAAKCVGKTLEDICHEAAKPVASINILKIRTRKGSVQTDDTIPVLRSIGRGGWGDVIKDAAGNAGGAVTGGNFKILVEALRNLNREEDTAVGYGFREYFGNHRPYMRWVDTGKEAFQVNDKPDYWCDWGQNDSVVGIGRDSNSIHGSKSQLCRYGGGGGIGNSCFTVNDWKKDFPGLAGSEWAELKLYQANCTKEGLNCLCQYEKIFKSGSSEEKALAMTGTSLSMPQVTAEKVLGVNPTIVEQMTRYWPLSWRGYASTPANRDNFLTSPAISTNQQFPYAFGDPTAESIIRGGLDKAQPNDIIVWPAGSGALPHTAVVLETNNLADYKTLNEVPNKSRWIRVTDANNGKYPDACGNTSYLGRGAVRTLYPNKEELPETMRKLIKEQVTSTYFCEDPELGHCVERHWDGSGGVIIYRPHADKERTGGS